MFKFFFKFDLFFLEQGNKKMINLLLMVHELIPLHEVLYNLILIKV